MNLPARVYPAALTNYERIFCAKYAMFVLQNPLFIIKGFLGGSVVKNMPAK